MSGQKRGKRALILSGEPRVQLLPPWLAEREKRRQARSLAGLVTVLAIVIAGAATGAAYMASLSAEDALKDAQAETATIQAQQLQYVDGAIAAGDVADLEEAITVVGATDILWEEVLAHVGYALPPEAVVDGFAILGRTPWEARRGGAGPLRGSTEASIDLVIASPQFIQAVSLEQALKSSVPAYADSYVYATEWKESRGAYETKVQLTVNVGVLSQRYAQEHRDALLASAVVATSVTAVQYLDAELTRLRAVAADHWRTVTPAPWAEPHLAAPPAPAETPQAEEVEASDDTTTEVEE